MEESSESPEAKGLFLISYLIMPVQRVPRYIMLLEDLLKHTPEDHSDHGMNALTVSGPH